MRKGRRNTGAQSIFSENNLLCRGILNKTLPQVQPQNAVQTLSLTWAFGTSRFLLLTVRQARRRES